MINRPLIYTSKGNLPVDELDYSTEWDVTDEYAKLTEKYMLNGEVVKESAHVYVFKSFESRILQGEI